MYQNTNSEHFVYLGHIFLLVMDYLNYLDIRNIFIFDGLQNTFKKVGALWSNPYPAGAPCI